MIRVTNVLTHAYLTREIADLSVAFVNFTIILAIM